MSTQETKEQEQTVFSEEREYFYTEIKNHWHIYRKAAKPIEVNINKVVASYHEQYPDWTATNIVRHIVADLWELKDQGFSKSSVYRMMDNENREKLQIKRDSNESRLFYKDTSVLNIDPEVEAEARPLVEEQKKEGLIQPEVLMKKDDHMHMQCFQREQDLKVENKALKGQVKRLQQENDKLKVRIKKLLESITTSR